MEKSRGIIFFNWIRSEWAREKERGLFWQRPKMFEISKRVCICIQTYNRSDSYSLQSSLTVFPSLSLIPPGKKWWIEQFIVVEGERYGKWSPKKKIKIPLKCHSHTLKSINISSGTECKPIQCSKRNSRINTSYPCSPLFATHYFIEFTACHLDCLNQFRKKTYERIRFKESKVSLQST